MSVRYQVLHILWLANLFRDVYDESWQEHV